MFRNYKEHLTANFFSGKTVKSVALLFGGGTGGDKTAAATPGQNNQDDNSKGGAPLPNTPMPRQKS